MNPEKIGRNIAEKLTQIYYNKASEDPYKDLKYYFNHPLIDMNLKEKAEDSDLKDKVKDLEELCNQIGFTSLKPARNGFLSYLVHEGIIEPETRMHSNVNLRFQKLCAIM